jgi:alpha-D-xyloside xylohydrolase
MLGPAVLVAPAMQPGTELQVYLPKGEAWWDLNTGWRYEGGTVWTISCGLGTIPAFGREGHMLCLGPTAKHTGEFNSARILDEVWMFGMPVHNPVVMRNKIRVMQMQGSSYIKGLEGLRISPSEGLEVKRRGAEVRISRAR